MKDDYLTGLRYRLHKELDKMFPGKEHNSAKYRWLKEHTMTTSHMSEMNAKELKLLLKEIKKLEDK